MYSECFSTIFNKLIHILNNVYKIKNARLSVCHKIISYPFSLLNPFSLCPIDYPTIFETKLQASKNESFTNSLARTLTGLFSMQSKTK